MHVEKISMELPILLFMGSQKFLNYDAFLSLLLFANRADPDEMPHYAAFHKGLHCLPKNVFSCIQNEKKLIVNYRCTTTTD